MRLPRPLALLLLLAACGEPAPAPSDAAGTASPAPTAGPGAPGQPQHPPGPGLAGPPGGPGGLPPFDPSAPTPAYEGDVEAAPSFPEVAPDAQGMVPVEAGWVLLGPRRVNRVPGVDLSLMQPGPAPGGPPGAAPGQPDADPAARAHGGTAPPPGVPPEAQLGRQGPAVPWHSTGGQQLQARRVWLEPFRIDRTEVTRAQYKRFLDATGYRPPHVDEPWAREGPWNWTGTDYPPGTGDHPVVLTSWYDALEYCAWAGKRLPTEAEWQLAALGPAEEGRIFPWGDTYGEKRMNHGRMEEPNFDEVDGYLYTSPVGSYPSGRARSGVEDAFGNAWEYTSDYRVDGWELVTATPHQDGYAQVHAAGPGLYVAVRGGSYFFDARPNPAGERNHFLPELRRKTSGFRCAAD